MIREEHDICMGYLHAFMKYNNKRIEKEKIKVLPPFYAKYFTTRFDSFEDREQHLENCFLELSNSIELEIMERYKDEHYIFRFEATEYPREISRFTTHEEIQGFKVFISTGIKLEGFITVTWGFIIK